MLVSVVATFTAGGAPCASYSGTHGFDMNVAEDISPIQLQSEAKFGAIERIAANHCMSRLSVRIHTLAVSTAVAA